MLKFFCLKLHFAHTQQGLQMCCWRHVIAGSSAPILLIQNLFSQNQYEIFSTGKRIIMVGRPEVLSQSVPSFRFRLSVVDQKSLNVSEQNCHGHWSEVWIQRTPKLKCAVYSAAVPLKHICVAKLVKTCLESRVVVLKESQYQCINVDICIWFSQ